MRQIKSRCGCIVERDESGKACLCEAHGADCTEDATVLLVSPIWEPRLAGRYAMMCDEEHVPLCRAHWGMPPEEE